MSSDATRTQPTTPKIVRFCQNSNPILAKQVTFLVC